MPVGSPRRPGRHGRRAVALMAAAALTVGCGGGVRAVPQPPRAADAHPADAGVVRVSSGLLRGRVAADYRLFQGIPYAAPPVGALRWQPPRPAPPWPGMRDASKPGPQCIQGNTREHGARPASEDCLTLNVWTPAAGGGQRPVMVWIHGGGFVNGSGDLYNARSLAARGHIVVVTINYRLGALGFLAHPALGPAGEVGNYGLADQQAALRWVRDNIASFGGDPAKVTVAGESAGAMSVCDHLVAPGSAGLFHAAIIQSGPCQAQADLATAQRLSVDYAASVGCPDLVVAAQCLRALPAAALARPPWYARIGDSDSLSGPVTGTTTLPVDPVAALVSGRAAKVPVLIGINRDEFTMFAALRYLRLGRAVASEEYPRMLADVFGAGGRAVLAHYPPERYGGDVSLAYSAAVTDGVFACPADRMAAGLRRGAPVYGYEFDDRDAPAPKPLRQAPFPIGASHSLELRYLFNAGESSSLDPARRQLSDQMISYWSRFVTTGAPDAPGEPAWPALGGDPNHSAWMSLRPDGSRVITDFAQSHQCVLWAALKGKR
ncbi:carboxylesterase family protein [Mycobacterium sp. SM1]|uniref:carboxylesterase/lipase family protein n=1 Tax=Mycobacterium sp. SM1 TaxID=2816243 RepID=UPI001BCD3BE7|nr:carboxylesterase family protein [Mycobacterium sp. SM1]MBS4728783.1 carboxylesterase family protein [Mycobacterium sp. SM1]